MRANDLRIGNYAEYLMEDSLDPRKEWWGVTIMHAEDILYLCENPDNTDYRPIPITKEWLEMFGFKESNNNWFGLKYFTECKDIVEEMKVDYNIFSNRLAIYDAIEETDMVNILSYPIYTAKKIKFLHQLQNLYFALSGEELTIKQEEK